MEPWTSDNTAPASFAGSEAASEQSGAVVPPVVPAASLATLPYESYAEIAKYLPICDVYYLRVVSRALYAPFSEALPKCAERISRSGLDPVLCEKLRNCGYRDLIRAPKQARIDDVEVDPRELLNIYFSPEGGCLSFQLPSRELDALERWHKCFSQFTEQPRAVIADSIFVGLVGWDTSFQDKASMMLFRDSLALDTIPKVLQFLNKKLKWIKPSLRSNKTWDSSRRLTSILHGITACFLDSGSWKCLRVPGGRTRTVYALALIGHILRPDKGQLSDEDRAERYCELIGGIWKGILEP